uniref:Uncharacterized protein n=1 Tax=Sinocyclocheilus rhinocerous TaxID=307959 RepID=A0A673FMB9_9TELE
MIIIILFQLVFFSFILMFLFYFSLRKCFLTNHFRLSFLLELFTEIAVLQHFLGNQYIKKECSATNNRVCQCKEGYFWQADFCIKHSNVFNVFIGTLHSDTKYERCARGTFSAVTSSTSPCVKHTECKSVDLHVVLRGTFSAKISRIVSNCIPDSCMENNCIIIL